MVGSRILRCPAACWMAGARPDECDAVSGAWVLTRPEGGKLKPLVRVRAPLAVPRVREADKHGARAPFHWPHDCAPSCAFMLAARVVWPEDPHF